MDRKELVSTPPGLGGHFNEILISKDKNVLLCLNPSRSGRSFQLEYYERRKAVELVSTPPGLGGHFNDEDIYMYPQETVSTPPGLGGHFNSMDLKKMIY